MVGKEVAARSIQVSSESVEMEAFNIMVEYDRSKEHRIRRERPREITLCQVLFYINWMKIKRQLNVNVM